MCYTILYTTYTVHYFFYCALLLFLLQFYLLGNKTQSARNTAAPPLPAFHTYLPLEQRENSCVFVHVCVDI